jgi:hypothetical protein
MKTGIQAAAQGIVGGAAESGSLAAGAAYGALAQASGSGDSRSKVKVANLR